MDKSEEQASADLAIARHQLNIIPSYGHRYCRVHDYFPSNPNAGCPSCIEIVRASEITFKNPDDAFDDAITAGRLSANETDAKYAGKWMYMGTRDGVDAFKNINTREYLTEDRCPHCQQVSDRLGLCRCDYDG